MRQRDTEVREDESCEAGAVEAAPSRAAAVGVACPEQAKRVSDHLPRGADAGSGRRLRVLASREPRAPPARAATKAASTSTSSARRMRPDTERLPSGAART